MEINFNHPLILQGYLEQAIPQYGLEDVKGIVVGKSGGLAYHLFADEGEGLPRELQIKGVDSIKKVKKYFDEIEAFLDRGSRCASNFGFRLVSIKHSLSSPDKRIYNGLDSESDIYCVGIGDGFIRNVEKFEKFLEMIKTNNQSIQNENKKLKEILSQPIIISKEELNLSGTLDLLSEADESFK
ncbi:hypothetical protein J4221_05560 [Candidatus Pacearchaeota archaeon]|nr:hypothetical protein [Candidatus Pacearchaeota archaeon]